MIALVLLAHLIVQSMVEHGLKLFLSHVRIGIKHLETETINKNKSMSVFIIIR